MTAAFIRRGNLNTDAGSGTRHGDEGGDRGLAAQARERGVAGEPPEARRGAEADTWISDLRPPDRDGPSLRCLVRVAPGKLTRQRHDFLFTTGDPVRLLLEKARGRTSSCEGVRRAVAVTLHHRSSVRGSPGLASSRRGVSRCKPQLVCPAGSCPCGISAQSPAASSRPPTHRGRGGLPVLVPLSSTPALCPPRPLRLAVVQCL